MATLVHHPALELEVFGPDTHILTSPDEYRDAADSLADRFVRITAVMGLTSLKETIQIANEQFDEIAAAIDAKVIDHRYGLIEANRLDDFTLALLNKYNDLELLPPGYVLGADVEVVKRPIPVDTVDGLRLEGKITAHNKSRFSHGLPVLGDMDRQQLARGRSDFGQSRIHIVDIEPRLLVPAA